MLLSQSNLAKLLGISQPSISAALKRGSLKLTRKKIDTDHPHNKAYIAAVELRQSRKRNKQGVKGKSDQDRLDEENSLTESDGNETFYAIDVDEVNEKNIHQFSKVDIDKLSVIERTKLSRIKALKERGKLIDRETVKQIFAQIVSIEEKELKAIPENVADQLAAYFQSDDLKATKEVRKKLEKEIYKVLKRIKNVTDKFLERQKYR